MVVIDYSSNGTEAGRYSSGEVAAMQRKPDGRRRIVLAYLSIGEAEDYRYYWDKAWVEPAPFKSTKDPAKSTLAGPASINPETVRIPRLTAPGWLGRENEVWSGNFHVRYWYDGWQGLMFYHSDSYLQRILDAGFDGVYLDRVDTYYAMESDRKDAGRRMIDVVVDLAKHARSKKPQFIILPQNGEELAKDPRYLSIVDGIAKEDLHFGSDGDGTPNTAARIAHSTGHLKLVQQSGRRVFVVEYLDSPSLVQTTKASLSAAGFVPYFAPRKLDRLNLQTIN